LSPEARVTVADCLAAPEGEPRLAAVREFFAQRGLLGRRLTVEREGRTYRLFCDQRSFSVHRINPHRGLPPGNPGWLVCRLDAEGLFEEAGSPELARCRLACGHKLADWLELAEGARP
jgi:hypothetical protein